MKRAFRDIEEFGELIICGAEFAELFHLLGINGIVLGRATSSGRRFLPLFLRLLCFWQKVSICRLLCRKDRWFKFRRKVWNFQIILKCFSFLFHVKSIFIGYSRAL